MVCYTATKALRVNYGEEVGERLSNGDPIGKLDPLFEPVLVEMYEFDRKRPEIPLLSW